MVKMSTPSDQSQRVTRVIYKQLLCLARHFDSRPALKALTINPLHSQQIKFTKISPSIERYYGKSLTFYFEPKSLTSSIGISIFMIVIESFSYYKFVVQNGSAVGSNYSQVNSHGGQSDGINPKDQIESNSFSSDFQPGYGTSAS